MLIHYFGWLVVFFGFWLVLIQLRDLGKKAGQIAVQWKNTDNRIVMELHLLREQLLPRATFVPIEAKESDAPKQFKASEKTREINRIKQREWRARQKKEREEAPVPYIPQNQDIP